jgi:hypothetical protein
MLWPHGRFRIDREVLAGIAIRPHLDGCNAPMAVVPGRLAVARMQMMWMAPAHGI